VSFLEVIIEIIDFS